MMNPLRIALFALARLHPFSLPSVARGGRPRRPYQPPEDIHFQKRPIVERGDPHRGRAFSLQSLDGKKLPTIIMCHGWGGEAKGLRCRRRYLCTGRLFRRDFDYRGWGASDARLVLIGPSPSERHGQPFTAEVKEVREVVDPLDQTTDLQNVIHWVQGEPLVTPARSVCGARAIRAATLFMPPLATRASRPSCLQVPASTRDGSSRPTSPASRRSARRPPAPVASAHTPSRANVSSWA